MQTLSRGIKDHTSKPVCLLFGEEAFLKKNYKSRLKEVPTGGDTTNHNYFEGEGMSVNEIIGPADTIPFFTGKCFVLMEDNGFFKGGAGADELTEYMGEIPESTCLTFVGSGVDKRGRLYKAVEKYGYVAKLSHQELAQFVRWVVGVLSKNGRKIIGHTMEFFLSKAGDDMENISSELEKLIGCILGREIITDKDVETICTTQVTNKISNTITAIAARQTRKAINLYEDLLVLREPPMCILFLIARQFDRTLQVRDPMGKGIDKSTVASRLKPQPSMARKIILQAGTFTREQILSYVDLCVDTGEGVKIGKLQDQLAVGLLIANKYG